jgi:hypothetical protein
MIMSILRNTSLTLRSGFIEVLLIFIGVTIAVAFGNWNDKRKEKIIERNYLELLSSEVNENRITLDRMILKYNSKIVVLKKIMDLTGPVPSLISMHSFDSLLFLGLSSPNFELTNSITDELLSSGNGNLIRDINLRILITQWNNQYNFYNSSDQKTTLDILEKYIHNEGSFTNIDKTANRFTYSKELKPANFFNIDNRKMLKDPVFQNLISDHLRSYIWFNDKYVSIKESLDSLSLSLNRNMKNYSRRPA